MILYILEHGDSAWITTDIIAINEKAKELDLFGHVAEIPNPFSCGGVPLQRVHFSK